MTFSALGGPAIGWEFLIYQHMYLTVHALAGALIGEEINNTWLAFILGLISHFILDRIPHHDPSDGESFLSNIFKRIKPSKEEKNFLTVLIIDLSAMTVFILILFSQGIFKHLNPAMAGLLGGILPDMIQGLYYMTGNKYLRYFKIFHNRCHFDHEHTKLSPMTGMVIQLLVLIIVVGVLLK